jgi:general secretion pathway protein G
MRGARGFSLIELVVALALIAVLGGVLLERTVYYQEIAEKANMEGVAADLRSSVNLRVGELMLANRLTELDALASENPFDLLVRKPQNYLGVLDGPSSEQVAPGNWYFDKKSKEVVYSVDLGRYFVPDEGGSKRVAWHVVLVKGAAKPEWARLELTRPYKWF